MIEILIIVLTMPSNHIWEQHVNQSKCTFESMPFDAIDFKPGATCLEAQEWMNMKEWEKFFSQS